MNFVIVVLLVFIAGVNTWNQLLQLCDVGQRRFPNVSTKTTLAMFTLSECGVFLGMLPIDLAVGIVSIVK
jgi:hypothetical protein